MDTAPTICQSCKPEPGKTINTNEKGQCSTCGMQIVKEVKFDLSFTDDIDKYIVECQDTKQKPTVKGFANRIGTDVFSLWQWANKKKKDEQGVLTDQFARPKFNAALTKLEALEKEGTTERLTTQQEIFCKIYVTDASICGNATRCYIKAYGLDEKKQSDYDNAMGSGSRLLRDAKIVSRMNEILEAEGLNDTFVDTQLLFLVRQNADLPTKRGAISDYNKVRGRITEKIDHTTKGKELPSPIYGGRAAEK